MQHPASRDLPNPVLHGLDTNTQAINLLLGFDTGSRGRNPAHFKTLRPNALPSPLFRILFASTVLCKELAHVVRSSTIYHSIAQSIPLGF